MPFVQNRPESKAVCLENARSLMFLYECFRAQSTLPGIRNVVAFYGFASAVFLETMSNSPADRKRVERLKEILEEDSQKSTSSIDMTNVGTIAFQAAQVLEFLRQGPCMGHNLQGPSTSLHAPPPIVLPYFGVVRIADKSVKTNIPNEQYSSKPNAVALHPPPPTSTVPQMQDDFYNMNMEPQILLDQSFGGDNPLNWAFNFAMDPATATDPGQVGGFPMDIEAWSSVCLLRSVLITVLERAERVVDELRGMS